MPPIAFGAADTTAAGLQCMGVQQLKRIANLRSCPHSLVQREEIVMACGAGETHTSIAKRMGLTGISVGK